MDDHSSWEWKNDYNRLYEKQDNNNNNEEDDDNDDDEHYNFTDEYQQKYLIKIVSFKFIYYYSD